MLLPTRRVSDSGIAGLGCSNPLAMNANSADNIPCVFGDATPPQPTQVTVTRPFGDSGTADVPMDSPETWLYDKVVTPAAGSPTGQYVDPALMQTMLQQAAQQYCAGTAYGVASGPCAGADLNSIVSSLTQTYAAQVAAKGGTPSVNLNNAPGYVFTSYAPGYNSAGPGYILMPDGSKVVNTDQNLEMAQAAYNRSLGLPANYQNAGGTGQSADASGTIISDSYQLPGEARAPSSYTAAGAVNTAATAPGTGVPTAGLTINGAAANQGAAAAVPSWFTDPEQEVMSGMPNWMLLAGAAAALMLLKK